MTLSDKKIKDKAIAIQDIIDTIEVLEVEWIENVGIIIIIIVVVIEVNTLTLEIDLNKEQIITITITCMSLISAVVLVIPGIDHILMTLDLQVSR